MMQENQSNEFKGFSLFNDIEDVNLRNRNRAVVLANIAENHSKNRRISVNGVGLILGYFKSITDDDKADVKNRFVNEMNSRGFYLVAA